MAAADSGQCQCQRRAKTDPLLLPGGGPSGVLPGGGPSGVLPLGLCVLRLALLCGRWAMARICLKVSESGPSSVALSPGALRDTHGPVSRDHRLRRE